MYGIILGLASRIGTLPQYLQRLLGCCVMQVACEQESLCGGYKIIMKVELDPLRPRVFDSRTVDA